MQLKLNVEQLNGYDSVLQTQLFQEESLELIVPDSYADIYRIVDTNGQIRLTGKSTNEGAFSVSGTLDICILYEPEDRRGVCRLESKLPFTLKQDAKEVSAETSCIAVPALRSLESKTLNPRKLVIRADVGAQIKLYNPSRVQLCNGIADDWGGTVQQRCKEYTALIVSDVREKEFAVRDEIRLQSGPAGQAEILCTTASAICSSAKVIGNKLVFKGETKAAVYYQLEDHVYCSAATVPFSQIMELAQSGAESECTVDLCFTAISADITGTDMRSADLNIELLAQISVMEKRPVSLLCDAYSTRETLSLERSVYTLRSHAGQAQCVKNVCQTLQTEDHVRSIVYSSVQPVQVGHTERPGDFGVDGLFAVRVMYINDDGMVRSLVKNIAVTGQLEEPAGSIVRLECISQGDVYAAPVADGLEVRFDVEFRWIMAVGTDIGNITSADTGDNTEDKQERNASVLLRMPAEGEDLWQLAKCCGTTMDSICRANELEGETLPRGRMLLIPRCSK